MEYPFKVSKEKYIEAAVSLINCISSLNLTVFELNIVTTMIKNNVLVVNASTRTLLRNSLSKDRFNLNNYLKRLRDKKVLIKKDKDLHLNPGILEAINDGELIIRLNVNKDN